MPTYLKKLNALNWCVCVCVCVNRAILSPIDIVVTSLYRYDTKASPTVGTLQQAPSTTSRRIWCRSWRALWYLSGFADARLASRALHWVLIPMPIHAHGFWVGMGAMLLFIGGHGCNIIVHGWAWVGIRFVHPCIQLQIGVKLLGCRSCANQKAL